ncbi:MAG TPA: hypothetical protein VE343_17250 [Streptosporangiaceae bacterium]|nr:hypothetical protein [Streptosporangiaceae bacterium]
MLAHERAHLRRRHHVLLTVATALARAFPRCRCWRRRAGRSRSWPRWRPTMRPRAATTRPAWRPRRSRCRSPSSACRCWPPPAASPAGRPRSPSRPCADRPVHKQSWTVRLRAARLRRTYLRVHTSIRGRSPAAARPRESEL